MAEQEKNKTPLCVGMIMDGNRRWAKENGKASLQGHLAGYNKMKDVADWVMEAGIKNLIVYAFSTENWKRAPEEVSYLMDLLRLAVGKELNKFKEKEVRISFIGELSKVSNDLKELIEKATKDTSHFKKLHLIIALSYGGRAEIVNAVKEISKTKTKDEIENMAEDDFSSFLWTKDIPDPDLVIRTSGEIRLSNFLPWQSVYSELFFTQTYWPDFNQEEFNKILAEFHLRQRRIGK
ncbi:MAG: di-trans,poly-cis-decaprenylcistransferase [Parcubacteria group bacterium]|nr:di-trans,poly-cis-decaprenylcistransferase [Parcubacteria group bacterium]